ncbi:MAG: histidine phosphatase family protein [Bradyrhizobiaceae bacterium]|nr:histidine phosphatase family protein [Bradyrhizobiaceae bacterium]
MRRLILLRHAKAVPQGDMDDEERPLAPRGRRDTPKIAEFAAAQALAPDLALVSPSQRTRETWELFAPAFRKAPRHRLEPRIYAASSERLLYLVRETDNAVQTLLLVGHNPGFEDLVRLLAGAGETGALIRFGGSMPTASLAVLDLPGNWEDVEPRTGRLEIFVTPKSLGKDDD